VWRSLLWVVALTLTACVVCVAVDAALRATDIGSTLTRGMGTPDNPSLWEERAAERNMVYLLGLTVGLASGVGVVVAAGLGWHLLRSRRQVT